MGEKMQKARRNTIPRRSSGKENAQGVISQFLLIAQANCINSVASIIGGNYSMEGPTAR